MDAALRVRGEVDNNVTTTNINPVKNSMTFFQFFLVEDVAADIALQQKHS